MVGGRKDISLKSLTQKAMLGLQFYPEDGGSIFLKISLNIYQTTRLHI
jgi:hypothetical protein